MTDDRIAQIANEHFLDCNQLTRHQFINFARAIEAECRERIAELEAEVERLRAHQLRTEQSASAIMDSQQKRIAELERQRHH